MICMKKGMLSTVSKIHRDTQGRLIIFDITEKDYIITIVALYAPNQDNPTFFDSIRSQIEERSEHKIIIGDFNLTLDIEKDRKNTYYNNNNAKEKVVDMMSEFCMNDIWRIQNIDKREFSWFKSGNVNQASRIDFALVSAGLDQRAKAIEYMPSVLSDHRPMYICIDLDYNGEDNLSAVNIVQLSLPTCKNDLSLVRNKKYICGYFLPL